MTCWLLSLLLATSSFAQDSSSWVCEPPNCSIAEFNFFEPDPLPAQERPIDVCRQIVASQDREIAVLIERISNLEQQTQVQAETIKAWENRASGKMTKKEWAVMVLSVVAAVGTVVGR